METRHLIILAAVAVVLTGAVIALGALENRQEVTLKEGSYLLQGFNPEKVYGIYIMQGDESLTFKRLDERFILTGKYDYPVSNDQINRIVKAIADIRCAEKVTSDERNHAALGVMGEKGSLVVRFFNESGQKMTGMVIGRDRPGFPGFYARLEDEKQVYLSTDALPPVSTNYVDYIRRDLPPGRKTDYVRISCKNGAGAFALDLREGKPVLEDVPKKQRQDDGAIAEVLKTLQQFPVRNIHRRSDLPALIWPTRLDFQRKDGTVYRIELAEKDGRHFARTVAMIDATIPTTSATGGGGSGQDAQQMARESVGAFNRDHEPWVYEIDAAWARTAQKKQADLLE
ncbi:MAG TPA: DUF4340 domain-containing protein [Syntrophales bacterium]|nr:DUF4340 domain-containing protein [Syntrophales bacterium]